ncbi:MAG: transcription termination/antitermination protein NusG [Ginsengibacter sp.]
MKDLSISGWYLIYTRPRMEKSVARELKEIQVVSYLPLVKSLRQWHDRRKLIEVPLFASYVFVRLCNLKDFHQCYNINGFVKFVRVGKELAKVDESIVKNLMIAIESGEKTEVSDIKFDRGEKLVILEGPLTGFYGELVQYKGKKRALVRVEMLGRNLVVDIASYILAQRESFS